MPLLTCASVKFFVVTRCCNSTNRSSSISNSVPYVFFLPVFDYLSLWSLEPVNSAGNYTLIKGNGALTSNEYMQLQMVARISVR